jgi:hypothetical protein
MVDELATPNGKRHNEARTLTQRLDGIWLVGGMHDGPGTHSADSDPNQLTAQGFVGALTHAALTAPDDAGAIRHATLAGPALKRRTTQRAAPKQTRGPNRSPGHPRRVS